MDKKTKTKRVDEKFEEQSFDHTPRRRGETRTPVKIRKHRGGLLIHGPDGTTEYIHA